MECPECGGPLDAYVLDGREASICERCGWVGIEADHRGEGVTPESWDDALARFYERHVATERRRSDLPPVAAADGEVADASPTADEGPDGTDGTPDDGTAVADLVDEAANDAATVADLVEKAEAAVDGSGDGDRSTE